MQIPAAPVNRLEDLEQDPHLQSVDFFQTLESPAGHRYRSPRNPVRLQRSEVAAVMPPALGQHTREVLLQAGLDEAAVAHLLDSGAARQAAPTFSTAPGISHDR